MLRVTKASYFCGQRRSRGRWLRGILTSAALLTVSIPAAVTAAPESGAFARHSLPDMLRPIHPATRGAGSIFVSATSSGSSPNAVYIFSQASGHALTGQITTGSGSGFAPSTLATDKQGNLYVANTGDGGVDVYMHGSTSPSEVLPSDSNFGGANGVAVDGAGDVALIANYGVLIYPAGATTPCVALQWQDASFVGLGDGAFDVSGDLFISLPDSTGAIAEVAGGCGATTINLVPLEVALPTGGIQFDAKGNLDLLDSLPSELPTIDVFKLGKAKPIRRVTLDNGSKLRWMAFGSARSIWVTADLCQYSCPGTVLEYRYPHGGSPVDQIQLPGSSGGGRARGVATSPMAW